MSSRALIASVVVALPAIAPALAQTRIPQGPQGTVTLPIGEYDRLLDRAAHPDPGTPAPPVAAVVGRADLRARVIGDTARGTLRLDGEVFRRGQVKVPLVGGATLADARADGRPLPLLHEGDTHTAVLPGPATFVVTLDWAQPVTSAPGRASFMLPTPAAASVIATLDLPGDPADVKVEPGLVMRRQTAAGRTTVDATLEPGSRAQVSWSVRETAAPAAPVDARILADVKSLVTIGDADLRMVSLVDLTVVQGEPRTFEVRLPAGFEVTAVNGSTLDTSAANDRVVTLTVRDPSVRRHQFLISLEQAHPPGSFAIETSFPTVNAVQREAGEAAVEGVGTVDVAASGDDELRRMDVREAHASLRSLARQPLVAAFRYQRRPGETRMLTLDVKRFADAPVLAAAAERGTATTLVTAEGRTLTEVVLWIHNRAQPFMKVTLPPGATMLSVEVAGEAAKPVMGSDGTRVPLLRTGFRPDGAYQVSFVYLNAGAAFLKRGDAELALPRVDVPVGILEWELFLPDRYAAKPNGGNVIPARFVATSLPVGTEALSGRIPGLSAAGGRAFPDRPIEPGQIVGRVVDRQSRALPGATVTVTGADGTRRQTVTDANGMYVMNGVPSGSMTVTGELLGFKTAKRTLVFDQRPRLVDLTMSIGGLEETVTVEAESPIINTRTSELSTSIRSNDALRPDAKTVEPQQSAPSQNVLNLQRRVAGVLPVRVDVPLSGTSYRFVRPLVLDEETRVGFRYKIR